MRLLVLSAYDAHSHRQWHSCLQTGLPDWDWTVLTLPPRHFSWRIRGNPLTWSLQQRQALEAGYDLVLATSMVDLATLRGLVPALAQIPSVLYFHENQFAYPQGEGRHGLVEAQMVSLYSALAAERLVFNSRWNRDSFLRGVADLLRKLPDQIPAGVVDVLAPRCLVLPVPVAVGETRAVRQPGALSVVWNHRWEYDKGPELLLDIVRRCQAEFRLHVVGQQFREQPPAFAELKALLQQRGALADWGFIDDRQAYWDLLARSDVVLSTAHHDFQGLAVLEACRLGCAPVVPDRLAYPEWLPPSCCYRDAEQAAQRLSVMAAQKGAGRALPAVDVGALAPDQLLPAYRELLASLAA